MRREHIELRNAARRGDPRACLAMGERLFTGTQGFVRNPRLALAYLQQELSRGSHPAMALVAEHAPLELLVLHRLQQRAPLPRWPRYDYARRSGGAPRS